MPLNFLEPNAVFLHKFRRPQPTLPCLGSNIPSARRPGQRFHFLQCRGSSSSLRFVNRHGGTIRRAGWFAFTRKVTHLPPKSLVSRPRVPTHASRCPRPTFVHSRIGWLWILIQIFEFPANLPWLLMMQLWAWTPLMPPFTFTSLFLSSPLLYWA